MFCHLVAYQYLPWAQYWLPLPFQNFLWYCGLPIFRFSFSLVFSLCSISFFRVKSAFSTIMYFFVILNLIFCAAFMTGWFTYFIYVMVYFISISDYFATIILPELSVQFLDKLSPTIFLLHMFDIYHIHRLPFFHRGSCQPLTRGLLQ